MMYYVLLFEVLFSFKTAYFVLTYSKSASKREVLLSDTTCYDRSFSADDTLLTALSSSISQVEAYEIPILVKVERGDSILYYVSAFIYTNAIQKNPPSAVINVNGRETLLYEPNRTDDKISASCLNNLIVKYRQVLHVDQLNTRKGLPPGTRHYYTHDPVWAKVTVIKGKVVEINTQGDPTTHIPVINYSF